MGKNMSLKKRFIGKKQNKQFAAAKRIDALAAYDEEYLNSYDMDEIKADLDGYSEYLDDRSSGSDWY